MEDLRNKIRNDKFRNKILIDNVKQFIIKNYITIFIIIIIISILLFPSFYGDKIGEWWNNFNSSFSNNLKR